MFLFAGHDTTSSALCFAYNRLHNNPDSLARLRAEHDAVFGPDPSTAASQIAATPTLLNQLPYTTAVIKETLRLDAFVSSVRQGHPDFFLTHPETRKVYPTDGFMLISSGYLLHRSPVSGPTTTRSGQSAGLRARVTRCGPSRTAGGPLNWARVLV
ncbi:Cytochrome monooxygenase aflN like protein [Verticillium longisporum]|uniref:Cytochrome monooxygenase aflN like protein n=1 Tax=Verticillium longisporum TaxID=100787 RepID=A0A8I2ZW86_VERLO|nr:Cytochrome monooxygenase aflN like protein [Verticillium longisporum]